MSRNQFVRFSAVLVALALLLPAVSGLALAGEAKGKVKAEISIANDAWLAGKQLKAGEYTFTADENKLTVLKQGKVVAEAPIQWQDATSKYAMNAVVLDGNQVREVRFSGKNRTAIVQQ